MKRNITVAIDGPSGAGKSTVAQYISTKYHLNYLDTGALFRCLGLYCQLHNLDVSADKTVEKLLKDAQISIKAGASKLNYFLNGQLVGEQIRNEKIGDYASKLSQDARLRQYILMIERDFAAASSVIMDGRDIGTVVLPNADIKIYLDARPEERAVRRYKELVDRGLQTDYKTVLEQINQRDYQDSHRLVAPLAQAKDAIYLDSSQMDLNEVLERVSVIVEQRLASKDR